MSSGRCWIVIILIASVVDGFDATVKALLTSNDCLIIFVCPLRVLIIAKSMRVCDHARCYDCCLLLLCVAAAAAAVAIILLVLADVYVLHQSMFYDGRLIPPWRCKCCRWI